MIATCIAYIDSHNINVQFEDGTIVTNKRYDHFINGDIKYPVDINPHIGETIVHGEHTYKIIKWRKNSDIDFIDELGNLYTHRQYYHFKKHTSFRKDVNRNSAMHIGEKKKMNCGEFATIISINNKNKTISIQFEDGSIRDNVKYSNFKSGRISKSEYGKNNRINEVNIMKNGQSAKIIAYRCCCDIDVEFEDGYIKQHTYYSSFKNGNIQNPNKPTCGFIVKGKQCKKSDFLGKELVMNCGLKCTIIDVINASSLTVKFENGEIKTNVAYKEFCNKSILPPSGISHKYVGEQRTMSNGQLATIIKYRNGDDVDIQFEDGFIKKHIKYLSFQRGFVKNENTPNPKSSTFERLGMSNIMNCGLLATIIEYNSAMDLTVQFEDGKTTHSNIKSFLSGQILHPVIGKSYQIKQYAKEIIGTKKIMSNGMEAEIIAYNGTFDITVQFEDGTKVDTQMSHFYKGYVAHPLYVRRQESYNELFVASYLKQLGFIKFPKGSLVFIDDEFKNMEFDMFHTDINGRKVAIEYDGGYVGHTQNDDFLKNELCRKNNIILIRIREPQLEEYTHNGVKMFLLSTAKLGSDELKQTIKNIVNYINETCKDNFFINLSLSPRIKTVDSYIRLGETKQMNNGMMATIIKYLHANDIDVKFEDGSIAHNKTYYCFSNGKIAHPNYSYEYLKHIGKTNIMTNGMVATIIEYRNHRDIDIQFEDGLIRENVSSDAFNRGKIRHPSKGMDARSFRHRKERLHEEKICKNGRKAKIIQYIKYDNITVLFDDGTEWNTTYQKFKLA